MTIRYRLRVEDIGAANEWWLNQTPASRQVFQSRAAALSALFVLFCFLGGYLTGGSLFFTLQSVVFALLLAFVLTRLARDQMKRRSMQAFASGPNAAYLGERTVELSEEGLLTVSPLSTTLYQWRAVQQIIATPQHALFVITPGMVSIVPRETVDAGNFDAFVAEARRLQAQAAGAGAGVPRERQAIGAR